VELPPPTVVFDWPEMVPMHDALAAGAPIEMYALGSSTWTDICPNAGSPSASKMSAFRIVLLTVVLQWALRQGEPTPDRIEVSS
jgi:hypothetical protein